MTIHETQCDSCAFRVVEDQSTLESDIAIENKYKVLRSLNGAPKKNRIVSVGGGTDKTETCFVNSPLWPSKAKVTHCPDRIDDSVSLESALALREARVSNKTALEASRIAFDAKTWAIIAAIIATIAFAAPYVTSYLQTP